MDNIFTLRPHITPSDLKDAIDERLIKAKAITSYLMADYFNTQKHVETLLYGAVLAIDGFIDEIEYLGDRLEKVNSGNNPPFKHLS